MHHRRLFLALLLAISVSGVAAHAAGAASVIGLWGFGEASGQLALDSGPFLLDGRLGANDTTDAADPVRITGRSGGALRFGSDDYVRLPDSAELAPNTVSVEAVVRASSSPGDYRYIASRGSNGCFAGSYGLYSGEGGGIAFYVFDGQRWYVTPAASVGQVWNGSWHHVAGTFDGATVRLWLDGRQVGSGKAAPIGSIDYGNLTNSSAFIGDYRGSCNLPFVGDIDMVRIWNGALSDTEVDRLVVDTGGAAPATDKPLKPADPGTSVAVPGGAKQSTNLPGAPSRACKLTLAPAKWKAGQRAMKVRVTIRGVPLAGAKLKVLRGPVTLTSGRTDAKGRVRLKLAKAPKARTKLVIRVTRQAACAPVKLRVTA